jgi:hypothetical protein
MELYGALLYQKIKNVNIRRSEMKFLTLFVFTIIINSPIWSMGKKSLKQEQAPEKPEMIAIDLEDGQSLEVPFERANGEIKVFGDLILTTESDHQRSLNQKAFSVKWKLIGKLWPNGIVPYEIQEQFPHPERITWAINMFHQHTNIKLVPRTTEKNFVVFRRVEVGCSSWGGMRGGRQFINLEDRCSGPTVMHEIGHAIGLFHEHQRPDRNQYIQVKLKNVTFKNSFNFLRIPRFVGKIHGPYDPKSIMQYGSYAFSKNGKRTMWLKNGDDIIPNRAMFSELDLKAISELYGLKDSFNNGSQRE